MTPPPWFQSAIQQRLDQVMIQIERQPRFRKLRTDELTAMAAMFSGVDHRDWPGFMEWEEKHLHRRAAEQEQLYLQGVKDGVQLVVALLDTSSSN